MDNQAIIGGILNNNLQKIDFGRRLIILEVGNEKLRGVAQYTEPASTVWRVPDRLAKIIVLLAEITKLREQTFLPPGCNHTKLENWIQVLTNERDIARFRPIAPGTHKKLWDEPAVMTWDAQQSGGEVRGSRMQWANAYSFVARVVPAAPQALEATGQKYADSPGFSVSDQTQFRGWILQLQMFIEDKPASFPEEQSSMRYTFNLPRGVGFGQILPLIVKDGTTGLEDLPALIQLPEAAFWNPNRMATVEWKMLEIKQWSMSSLSKMLSSMLLPAIFSGVSWPWGLLSWWGCLRRWWTVSPTVICMRSFAHL